MLAEILIAISLRLYTGYGKGESPAKRRKMTIELQLGTGGLKQTYHYIGEFRHESSNLFPEESKEILTLEKYNLHFRYSNFEHKGQ